MRPWPLFRLLAASPFLVPVFILYGIWRLELIIMFFFASIGGLIAGVDDLPVFADWLMPGRMSQTQGAKGQHCPSNWKTKDD